MNGEKHVFVVDDDPSVRIGIGRLLRAAGYNVRIFSNANEFIDFINTPVSGCLILDVRIPGISGKELVAAMKNCGRRLSIIIVSADDDQEARKLAKDMGAIGFFRKPVDGTALLDTIKWTLKVNLNEK